MEFEYGEFEYGALKRYWIGDLLHLKAVEFEYGEFEYGELLHLRVAGLED